MVTHINETNLGMVLPVTQQGQVAGAVHQPQSVGHLVVGKAVQCQVSLPMKNNLVVLNWGVGGWWWWWWGGGMVSSNNNTQEEIKITIG